MFGCCEQVADQCRSDEARAASDQNPHIYFPNLKMIGIYFGLASNLASEPVVNAGILPLSGPAVAQNPPTYRKTCLGKRATCWLRQPEPRGDNLCRQLAITLTPMAESERSDG
ncbi:hypothetical protein D9M68_722840 [compost metagenome]